MKYLKKSFSVFMGGNKQYEVNYDRIFGERKRNDNTDDNQDDTSSNRQEGKQ